MMDDALDEKLKIESAFLKTNESENKRGFLRYLFALLRRILGDGNVTVRITFLSWRDIIEWFTNWLENPDHKNMQGEMVGFTINETMKKDKFVLVQGVFNKSTNTVEDTRRIQADEVDAEVKEQCFGKEKITLFT